MNSVLNKSISELEGWKWKDEIPGGEDSFVVRNFYRLHDKLISELGLEDIRFLIGQNSGLKYLVPIAMEKLRDDLFLEAEFYPGDLFCSLLLINNEPNYWISHPDQKQELISLFTEQRKRVKDLDAPGEIKNKIDYAYNVFLGGA